MNSQDALPAAASAFALQELESSYNVGKSDDASTDPYASVSTFYTQVESLRASQITLTRRLATERAVNRRAEENLQFHRTLFDETLYKRSQVNEQIAARRLKRSMLQLELNELQKELLEEEEYIGKVEARTAEIASMNEETLANLRRHRTRVAGFHRHFSQFNSVSPASRDTQTVEDELEQLKLKNQAIRAEMSKYAVRVLAIVEQLKDEKKQLELSATEAKARLSQIKDRLSKVALEESARIQELRKSLEVQHATNEAIEAEIEAKERQLFGASAVGGASEWPEL